MGGEYSRLRVIPGRDIIVLAEKKNTLKIFPPKSTREGILQKLHKSGKKSDTMTFNCRMRYTWPGMRQQIKSHVEGCSTCLLFSPTIQSSGLRAEILVESPCFFST